MGNVNKVLLLGRLTHDPELRFTPQGTAVCDLSVAVNRVSKTPDGKKRDEVTFIRVTVWGPQAEASAQYLRKGRQVHVEGRLTLDQWEDKTTQQKRSRLKVTAERIQFVGGRKPGSGESPETPAKAEAVSSKSEEVPF